MKQDNKTTIRQRQDNRSPYSIYIYVWLSLLSYLSLSLSLSLSLETSQPPPLLIASKIRLNAAKFQRNAANVKMAVRWLACVCLRGTPGQDNKTTVPILVLTP